MKNYLEKRREELRKRGGGFTLMEMLIVVAIIAVLIAIAIPVFTSQLERSRESTDGANIRNGYAEIMVAILADPTEAVSDITIDLHQAVDGWQDDQVEESLEVLEDDGDESGQYAVTFENLDDVGPDRTATWSYDAETGSITCTIA